MGKRGGKPYFIRHPERELRKGRLVRMVAYRTGLGVGVVEKVVDALFGNKDKRGAITDALCAEYAVILCGFGRFISEWRPPTVRKKGEEYRSAPPAMRVRFTPGKTMKARLKLAAHPEILDVD